MRGGETEGEMGEEEERGSKEDTIEGESGIAEDGTGGGWPGQSLTLFAGDASSKYSSESGIWCIE